MTHPTPLTLLTLLTLLALLALLTPSTHAATLPRFTFGDDPPSSRLCGATSSSSSRPTCAFDSYLHSVILPPAVVGTVIALTGLISWACAGCVSKRNEPLFLRSSLDSVALPPSASSALGIGGLGGGGGLNSAARSGLSLAPTGSRLGAVGPAAAAAAAVAAAGGRKPVDPSELPPGLKSKWDAAHPPLLAVAAAKLAAAIGAVVVAGASVLLLASSAGSSAGEEAAGRAVRAAAAALVGRVSAVDAAVADVVLTSPLNSSLALNASLVMGSGVQAVAVSAAELRGWANLADAWETARVVLLIVLAVCSLIAASCLCCAVAISARNLARVAAACSGGVLVLLAFVLGVHLTAAMVVSDVCDEASLALATSPPHSPLFDVLAKCDGSFAGYAALSASARSLSNDLVCAAGLDVCTTAVGSGTGVLPSPCTNDTAAGVGVRCVENDLLSIGIDTAVPDYAVATNSSVCPAGSPAGSPLSLAAGQQLCVFNTATVVQCATSGVCVSPLSRELARAVNTGLAARRSVSNQLAPAATALANCSYVSDLIVAAYPHVCDTHTDTLDTAVLLLSLHTAAATAMAVLGLAGIRFFVPVHMTRSVAASNAAAAAAAAAAAENPAPASSKSVKRTQSSLSRRSSRRGTLSRRSSAASSAHRRSSGAMAPIAVGSGAVGAATLMSSLTSALEASSSDDDAPAPAPASAAGSQHPSAFALPHDGRDMDDSMASYDYDYDYYYASSGDEIAGSPPGSPIRRPAPPLTAMADMSDMPARTPSSAAPLERRSTARLGSVGADVGR